MTAADEQGPPPRVIHMMRVREVGSVGTLCQLRGGPLFVASITNVEASVTCEGCRDAMAKMDQVQTP